MCQRPKLQYEKCVYTTNHNQSERINGNGNEKTPDIVGCEFTEYALYIYSAIPSCL